MGALTLTDQSLNPAVNGCTSRPGEPPGPLAWSSGKCYTSHVDSPCVRGANDRAISLLLHYFHPRCGPRRRGQAIDRKE